MRFKSCKDRVRSGLGSHLSGAGSKVKSYGKLILRWQAPLIQKPVCTVLSSIQKRRVRALLMGGQVRVL